MQKCDENTNCCFLTFFDRRAKEKRLKKDAGRARWGQYFRNGNGTGGSNGGSIGVSKDGIRASKIEDLKEDLILGFSSGKLLSLLILYSFTPIYANFPVSHLKWSKT